MPATSPDGIRYPSDLDPPDIPSDMRKLAEDVQAALTARGGAVKSGPVADLPIALEPGDVYLGY